MKLHEKNIKRLLKSGRLLTETDMRKRGWNRKRMFTAVRFITDITDGVKKYYWKTDDVLEAETSIGFYLIGDDD